LVSRRTSLAGFSAARGGRAASSVGWTFARGAARTRKIGGSRAPPSDPNGVQPERREWVRSIVQAGGPISFALTSATFRGSIFESERRHGVGIRPASAWRQAVQLQIHRRSGCSRSPARSHRSRRRVAAGCARAEDRNFFGRDLSTLRQSRKARLSQRIDQGVTRRAWWPCTSSASMAG